MKLGRFALTVVASLSFTLNILFYLSGAAKNLAQSQERQWVLNNTSTQSYQTGFKLDITSGFPINHPEACRGDVDLIVVVCSSLHNFKVREFVRNSWGRYSKNEFYKTRLVFLVGTGDRADMEKVQRENGLHKDIILGGFVDTYRNLTIKSVFMLKWISSYCANAKYGLKADDDVFVNIPNLISAMNIKRQKLDKFIIGSKQIGAKPIQDKNSKWYTPKHDFGEKVYPPYVSGPAYAFTVSAAKTLHSVTSMEEPFWLEDIYITGLCARAAGIPRFEHSGFTYQKRDPTGCAYQRKISGHYVTGDEMLKIFRELVDRDLTCK
ncbi:beta-1,3-galactosyltransferase 1-like [Ostrea edulis]|uniref:beta-1,3-galactosyltransferase 1-like n=1 Tax=Ostrea edulis TaxID=37623 RepID=UPI0024AF66BD|nr:beta-1,3-galactosyltransferase 1-like [Ostrea edulis]XP_048779838.2 beta-1,3-galactosyltransferase 1-like [Ostrea edulis]XP_048779839.2 beta-1,3-galactosyltransferase 1-like [Ostrea edulis]XP_048779840.2 beta-1,3-galactosyltransferase 1-like [Ostrea edulis]XP_048779841.2 beta-1,3-galactosyltransferase 1-like [Ostrea edulis]XP_048779842.2 beta-1,3-galactosyltransferase 1-like [Ostrea edulis]XP_055995340.1 beta-1,3-galactosyltransferase 1-like [Ostrea edulis]